jgi:beta-xylosidase
VLERGRYKRPEDATSAEASVPMPSGACSLRVHVDENAVCVFSWSADGKSWEPIGSPFRAQKGMWIGAKVGLFCVNPNLAQSGGFADFDFMAFE